MKSYKSAIIVIIALTATATLAIAANNFVRAAGQIKWTNPSAAVSSGDAINLGSRYGIAGSDIASNATGTVFTEGVFDIALESNQTVTVDAKLYYTGSVAQTTTNGAVYIGLATEAVTTAAATQGKVNVDLNAPKRDNAIE